MLSSSADGLSKDLWVQLSIWNIWNRWINLIMEWNLYSQTSSVHQLSYILLQYHLPSSAGGLWKKAHVLQKDEQKEYALVCFHSYTWHWNSSLIMITECERQDSWYHLSNYFWQLTKYSHFFSSVPAVIEWEAGNTLDKLQSITALETGPSEPEFKLWTFLLSSIRANHHTTVYIPSLNFLFTWLSSHAFLMKKKRHVHSVIFLKFTLIWYIRFHTLQLLSVI